MGVVMASSPVFKPAAKAAACKAAVPELKLTAYAAPTRAANASSNSSDLRSSRQPVGAQNIDHGLNVVLINRLPSVRQKGRAHRCSPVDRKCLRADRSRAHDGYLSGSSRAGFTLDLHAPTGSDQFL